MDIRKVKKLIELLEESGIAEIEIKEGEEAVRISRMPSGGYMNHAPAPVMMLAAPAAAVAAAPAVAPAIATAAASPRSNDQVVTSPMVGTFYASPSPGAKPFVEIGDEVKVGQILCIVEAMKLLNEIESDVAGEIVKKKGSNGQPIEYGQELFAIRAKK